MTQTLQIYVYHVDRFPFRNRPWKINSQVKKKDEAQIESEIY